MAGAQANVGRDSLWMIQMPKLGIIYLLNLDNHNGHIVMWLLALAVHMNCPVESFNNVTSSPSSIFANDIQRPLAAELATESRPRFGDAIRVE